VRAEPQRVRYTEFGKCCSEAEVIGGGFESSRCSRVGASKGWTPHRRRRGFPLDLEQRRNHHLTLSSIKHLCTNAMDDSLMEDMLFEFETLGHSNSYSPWVGDLELCAPDASTFSGQSRPAVLPKRSTEISMPPRPAVKEVSEKNKGNSRIAASQLPLKLAPGERDRSVLSTAD
jgi:hypothetical protein